MAMTSNEFVKKLKDAATNHKTMYVLGCFGAPMTTANKKRYTSNLDYNRKRADIINAASADTFGFDCVCLIKGILWGWNGNKDSQYGGAKYNSNNVPDIGADQIIKVCKEVSTDFSSLAAGEVVWVEGHVGVYIGNGLVVECTPKWKNGVQITACNCNRTGYNRRDWKKHGKLPYIEYVEEDKKVDEKPVEKNCTISAPILQKGSKGQFVKTVQQLLIWKGYSCGSSGADGDFGAATESAVKAFQKSKGLAVDGICGANTWSKILGA